MMDTEETRETVALFDRVRKLLQADDHENLDCGSSAAFGAAIRRLERDAFDRGFQLAARVEQRAAELAAATLVLKVLGKDGGDGVIDLGALGKWSAGNSDGTGGPLKLENA